MANEVRITIGADTKDADQAVKSFKDKLNDISGKAKGAGLALSAMGAGGVVAIKGFADAALVQQKAVDALTATMANAGESFADVEDKIMSTTAALQKKTNFGDEAQIAALSQLIPILGSTELALAALPAVMDVAALQGTDLLSTVKTMGPALAGLTDRVRGTALEFDAADDPLTRINKTLEQVGGTAESQADPFTQMGNAIGDVKEKIGAQLLPLITPLIEKIQSLAERIQEINPRFIKIAALVLAGATAFGVIAGPILLLIGFLPAMAAGFAMLSVAMGPITLVILGIAAAVAAGILIWKNWDGIMSFVRNTITRVKDTFADFRDMVVGAISSIGGTIRGVFLSAIGMLVNAFSAIKAAYETNWSWLLPGGALINAFLIVKALIWDDLIAAFQAFMEKARDVGDAVKAKWQEVQNRFGDFKFIIEEKLTGPMEDAKGIVIGVWDSISDGIKGSIDKIKNFIQGLIDKVKELIKWVADSPIGKVAGAISGFMGNDTNLAFANGGMVPGPIGAPVPAIVHGGELVLNPSQQAAMGGTTNSFNITVNGNVDDPAQMARLIADQVNAILGESSIRNEATRSR
jgi:phage-related protein